MEKVAPLEEESAELQRDLQASQTKLAQLQDDLSTIDEAVAKLKKQFETSTQEGTRLRMELEEAQLTIASAESLIGKLDGERTRWGSQVRIIMLSSQVRCTPKLTGTTALQVKVLDTEVAELELRALVSAAFVAYLPKESEDSRQRMLSSWSAAVGLEEFDVLKFLVSESQVLTWKKEGLSPDALSLQNALVVEHAVLTPYFIDPSSTATQWLAEHLKDGRVEVISQQDANFSSALELAVRFGKTLIIQEMDAIDPVL